MSSLSHLLSPLSLLALGRSALGRSALGRPALERPALNLINTLLPPRCIQCGREVSSSHTLCSLCWQHVRFFLPPWCQSCGLPSSLISPEQPLCLSCLSQPKIFDFARSVFAYDNHSRTLITTLKHGDKYHAAHALALWMARIISSSIPSHILPSPFHHNTLVIPIPSHRRTLIRRQFYPSALLAKHIAHHLNLTFAPTFLSRRLYASQHKKTAAQRYAQVRNAFSLSEPRLTSLPHLALLVDDVITTGATISACTHLLKQAGIHHVIAISAARVPRTLPQQPSWISPSSFPSLFPSLDTPFPLTL